jgi:hypothetical protein
MAAFAAMTKKWMNAPMTGVQLQRLFDAEMQVWAAKPVDALER